MSSHQNSEAGTDHPAAPAGVERRSLLSRIRRYLMTRARLWGFMVPLHLLAFFLLYAVSTRLLVNEIVSSASAQATEWLIHESGEIFQLAPGGSARANGGHDLDRMMESHGDIGLRLFLPGGRMVGGSELPMVEHKEMIDFLKGTEAERVWLSDEGDARLMRGLKRVVSTPDCVPCHETGRMLAISSMTMDLSGSLQGAITRGRRNMLALIVGWAALLTISSVIVSRSVKRSASSFEAQLAAAGRGADVADQPPDLVLDSTTARLQSALRSFLQGHRERQEQVATRLAHTDQLASLGQLAAGLAHEIKNPLAGIQGALEILREDEVTDSTKLLYSEMLSELERVNSTLQSLLASARPKPPQISDNDACRILEDVQRLLRPGLRRRQIDLQTEFAAEKIIAPLDAGKIRQVLINLIQNAADAVEENGTVNVSVARCPDGTGAIFVVEDDGQGISEEHQESIFEPFFTTKFAGTGLGLAITRSLVEQHGGTLQFESTPGEGTTFFVILPEAPRGEAFTESEEKSTEDQR